MRKYHASHAKDENEHAHTVIRHTKTVTQSSPMKFCKENVADYKVPKKIHFVEDFKEKRVG